MTPICTPSMLSSSVTLCPSFNNVVASEMATVALQGSSLKVVN